MSILFVEDNESIAEGLAYAFKMNNYHLDYKTTMKDAKGRTFVAVNYCKYCYNVIYQEEALAIQSMAEKDNAFCDVAFRYFFTTESGSEVTDILQGKITGRTQSGHWEQGVM